MYVFVLAVLCSGITSLCWNVKWLRAVWAGFTLRSNYLSMPDFFPSIKTPRFLKSFSWNTDFNFKLQAKKPNKKPEFLGVHSIHSGEKDPRTLEVWWQCNALVSVGVLVWPWNGWIPSALRWAPKWPSIALHQRRGRFPGPTKNPWEKWSPKREPKLNHVFVEKSQGDWWDGILIGISTVLPKMACWRKECIHSFVKKEWWYIEFWRVNSRYYSIKKSPGWEHLWYIISSMRSQGEKITRSLWQKPINKKTTARCFPDRNSANRSVTSSWLVVGSLCSFLVFSSWHHRSPGRCAKFQGRVFFWAVRREVSIGIHVRYIHIYLTHACI